MTEQEILTRLRNELRAHIDTAYQKGSSSFFQGEAKVLGVRLATVRTIARKYYPEMKTWDRGRLFGICETLLASGYNEEATVAFEWAVKRKKEFRPEDLTVFKRWMSTYADNWAKVDDLSTHLIGVLLHAHPVLAPKIQAWATSKNRWMRRASAVSFIVPTRKGALLQELFTVATTLLMDSDDLVQKGYGWALKEASKASPDEVFAFVLKHKSRMPRTALRYAIEKYPQSKKNQAMR
jgi:3-methyladenine DNA glycosylase AlkD